MTLVSTELEEYKMTELGPLLWEWEVVTLGDLFDFQQGKAVSPKSRQGISPRPFLRTANVLWGRLDLSVLDQMDFSDDEAIRLALCPGDLLVCEGGDVGRTAMWRGEVANCYYQNHIHRLRPKRDDVCSEYYMYWMQVALLSLGLYIGQDNRTTIPNLSTTRLKSFVVPLPPLPEQKKIAHVLSTIQTAIEKTEAVIKATRELKKSVMKHLFTYGPVPVSEAENVPLKETEIGPVPEHWEVVRLGDIAEVKYGKANPNDSGTIPVVGSGGVYTYTATPLVEYPTIVVGRKGTAGRVWLFQVPCYPADTTFYLHWKETLNVTFLFHYMAGHPLSGERARTTLPSLQKPDLENMFVPRPALPIQDLIANLIMSLDEKIQAEEGKKQALEALFQTLLKNLMTGRIRVNNLEVPV